MSSMSVGCSRARFVALCATVTYLSSTLKKTIIFRWYLLGTPRATSPYRTWGPATSRPPPTPSTGTTPWRAGTASTGDSGSTPRGSNVSFRRYLISIRKVFPVLSLRKCSGQLGGKVTVGDPAIRTPGLLWRWRGFSLQISRRSARTTTWKSGSDSTEPSRDWCTRQVRHTHFLTMWW